MKLKPNKKVCSIFLAASFAAQTPFAASAFAKGIQPSDMSDVSSLGIDINLDLPVKGDIFHVTLNSSAVNKSIQKDLMSNADGTVASGVINDIPVGKYTMTITSESYAVYTQEVNITKGFTTKIELNNSKQKNERQKNEENKMHGVMAVGDVNSDGKIDEKDSDEMINVIENGTVDTKYDLNGDGVVDIADLTYVTLNYGSNVTAVPLGIVSSENISLESGTNTKIDGNLEDLTENADKFVQFAPVNGLISSDNPIELSLEINNPDETQEQTVSGIVIKPPAGSLNLIESGVVTVEDEDGNTYSFIIGEDSSFEPASYSEERLGLRATDDRVTVENDGTVVINIGTQIAIKKVTIFVTGSSTNLVDIAKVEFVNNMEDRIPEPDLCIPENIVLEQLSAGENPSFRVEWEPQVNITGYEILISSNGKEVTQVSNTESVIVNSLGSGKISSYVPYTVRVRSTNGSWKSPYSESAVITLKPQSVPPAPEYVTAVGQTEAVKVSWRDMRDTQHYSLYYREKGTEEYLEIKNIDSTSYVIANLKPNAVYEVYVVGYNEFGASPASKVNQATTTAAENVRMPEYKLINTSNGAGQTTAHIKDAQIPSGATITGDNFAVVDENQATYTVVNDWDTGVIYGNFSNPIITLDQKYTLDTIRFAPSASQPYGYSGAKIRYHDDEGNWLRAENCSISQKKDINGNVYYTVTADKPITSDTFQLCVTTGYNRMISISEMKFYYYDDLASKINGLYEDTMHLQLKPDITEASIDALETQLNVKDSVSGELHPDYDSLKKELDYARELLNTSALADIIQVDTGITPNADKHTDFAMSLSNYQPLGTVAMAGEEIIVYVGSPNEKEGTKTNLNLIATQNHGEASQWQSDLGQLQVGRNVITIPNIATSAESENGGSLYVAWGGSADARQYSVRVSGGEKIPVLNVAGKTGAERTEAIKKYVEELDKHVSELTQKHNQNHTDKEYRVDCISNYTEIVMDNMMYSVPAVQVLSGLNGGGAQRLEEAIAAMEQQVDLFYQHKGYGKNVANDSKNKYPTQRLNIRYHTMFTGAFMYAGGKHIGIEYGSVPELFSISPVTSDENGKKTGGRFTGWGIGHEIGHVINSGSYAVAEVTNNYFAMLATQTPRTNYQKVYSTVTKGTIGESGDVFTTLGMYWQLHMFYDNYYDFKTFDDNEEQLENLFFARVDSYVRNPASAPSNGVALTLSGSGSDKFMRLACAAAEKNLLPFFEAWGLNPDEETRKYAEQFEMEEHKIQYMNYEAREYRLDGGAAMNSNTNVTAEITTPHDNNVVGTNKITLALGNNGGEAMLGYEIIRNGEPVAFVLADETSYTDVITTGNNMVYEYQVVGYDKLLNETEAVSIAPVKVKHQGEIDRSMWGIETNMLSDKDETIIADGDSGYCEDTFISAISNIIGQGDGSGYNGTAENGNAEFIIDLGGSEQVTAIKYNGDAAGFTVYVSDDKQTWAEVKKGNFDGGKEETVYFNQPDKADQDGKGYMYIYRTSYVKVVFNKSSISINDVNILGPTSDNVELLSNGIGTLKDAFIYDKTTEASIPAGSLVFTGVYKGSPAYNVVKLLDESGNIISGSQIIMAEDPEDGELGNVSEGVWIFWIEPEDIPSSLPQSIKAELYRVDNAVTLENERLVSNTLFAEVPSDLPEIKIDGETVSLEADVREINEEDKKTDENKNTANNAEVIGSTETTDTTEDKTDATEDKTNTTEDKTDTTEDKTDAAEEENTETEYDESVIEEVTVAARNVLASNEVAASGRTIRVLSLAAEGADNTLQSLSRNADGSLGFIFTKDSNDSKKALMQLNLGNESMDNVIAFQTSFKVSDPKVTEVNIRWSDAVKRRAILKECRYNAKKGMVYIYVTANEDLLDGGVITLGDIEMKAASGVTAASLTLNPASTVALAGDFSRQAFSGLSGDVTLSINNSSLDNNDKLVGGYVPSGGSSALRNEKDIDEDKDDVDSDEKVSMSEKDDNTSQNTENLSKPDNSDFTDITSVFSDISKNAWYYDAVQQAYNNKWFMGTSANKFSPDATMTRGMFVTVLGRFANASGTPSNKFEDVPANAYYAGFVAWAAEQGIVSGISDMKFAPDSAVTREQLAVMVYNYLKFKEIDLELSQNKIDFTDDTKLSAWAKDAVHYMQRAGIINGMPDGSFKPQGTATRAEVATILMNLNKKLK